LAAGSRHRAAPPRRPDRARPGRRVPRALGLGREEPSRDRGLRGRRLRAGRRERPRGDDAAHVLLARGESQEIFSYLREDGRVRVMVVCAALALCLDASAAAPDAGWTTYGDGPTRAGVTAAAPTTLSRDFVVP